MNQTHLWAQPLHGLGNTPEIRNAWAQTPYYTPESRLYGAFHPAALWHIATSDSADPPPSQSGSSVQQVAKVALWSLPVSLVLGAVGMHFWMKRKKRR